MMLLLLLLPLSLVADSMDHLRGEEVSIVNHDGF